MKVEGRTAVITGAATGMGRELALRLVKAGCSVALGDVNMKGLDITVADCLAARLGPFVKVTGHKCDVSSKLEVERFKNEVQEQHNGTVHLLFANAGINGYGKLIPEPNLSREEVAKREKNWDLCFNVNYYGVLYCIKAFIPMIVSQDEGYVVITSSVNGFWTWPNHGSYTASKFAVNGLAQALLCETYITAPHVHVACVHPGKINTDILENSLQEMGDLVDTNNKVLAEFRSKWKTDGGMTPSEAARVILNGVENNSTKILVGADAYGFFLWKTLFGNRTYDIFKRFGKEGFIRHEADAFFKIGEFFMNSSLLCKLRILFTATPIFIFVSIPVIVDRFPILKAILGTAGLYQVHKRAPKTAQLLVFLTVVKLLRTPPKSKD